jgi:hypothetical protein
MTATLFIIAIMSLAFLFEKDQGDITDPYTPAWYCHKFRRIFKMNYTYTTVDSRVFVIRNDIGQGHIDINPDAYVLTIHGFDTTFAIRDGRPLDDIKKLFNLIQSGLNPSFGKDLARDVANLPVSKNYARNQ